MKRRITSAHVSRIGLTPCPRLGIGELDCFVCAMACLVGAAHSSNLEPPTIRDAHVWLYWAGMPAEFPANAGSAYR